ncbi:hypothetical protein ACFHYQ_26775 [Sphaerimonospora cavernae]|uniref:Uncharacterized protein n=1 Tax=Sphaerimonospora cavernae TaxID=1740611 RepID=A0ABV6UCP6_9ACTN
MGCSERGEDARGCAPGRPHSISLQGDYEQAEEGFPAPKFGHPKDRRPDLKQIQAGIAVTGDGAVPVFHRAFDGGAGEVGQVIGTMKALQQLASRQLPVHGVLDVHLPRIGLPQHTEGAVVGESQAVRAQQPTVDDEGHLGR